MKIPFPKTGTISFFDGVVNVENSSMEKKEKIEAERKNNVVAEKGSKFFFLLKTENKPKIAAASKTIKLTERLFKLTDSKLPFVKTITTPKKPKIIAKIFRKVAFSFKNKKEKITIKIGQVY